MPSRNVVKVNVPDCYYHVYARGSSKQQIFLDDDDYRFFLKLFERYLSKNRPVELSAFLYRKLHNSVELLAYCLMPNHFHLLVYQIDESGMSKLMHGIMTSYSRYFNKKYSKSGPLFESRYKASRISSEDYLLHISRYIHANPSDWLDYPQSSLRAYLYDDTPDWLSKKHVSDLYESAVKYLEFLNDYKDPSEEIIL